MAVPSDMTLRTLNGKFTTNKTLSDPFDKLLALQGFPYLVRVAARAATITSDFTSNELPDATDGSSRIKTVSTVAGVAGIGMSLGKGKTDERNIDGVAWEEDDPTLGPIVGRAWWCSLADLSLDFPVDPDAAALPSSSELNFLRGFDGKDAHDKELAGSQWRLKAGGVATVDGGDEVIRLQVQAKKSGAIADHAWGFETGFGEGEQKNERRYTRRLLARNGGKVERARMVYDYLGPS